MLAQSNNKLDSYISMANHGVSENLRISWTTFSASLPSSRDDKNAGGRSIQSGTLKGDRVLGSGELY